MARRRRRTAQTTTAIATRPSTVRLSDYRYTRPARPIRASYDAAQTTDENTNHWAAADALSANAALSPYVRRILRNRSRYEIANNSYAAGMVETLANDTIGPGPTLQMLTGNDRADRAIETAYWTWQRSVRFPQKLRVMREAKAGDGESFAIYGSNYALRTPVKLDLRVYEADQFASPNQTGIFGDEDLSDGIFYDDFGNPTAYTLLKHHPGEGSLGFEEDYERIPARDVLHYYRQKRAGQTRGVPEITPALPLYAQLRRYTLAVLAAAETAADFAAILKSTDNTLAPGVAVEPFDAFEITKRMISTMPAGWDISQLRAEQPTTTYEMFKRAIIQEIARCLNMPYNVAAGDSSTYNYASGRLDHKTYFKSIAVERSDIVTVVLDPTFERWWEEARRADESIPPVIRRLEEAPPHEWRWPGDEHVDPLKEASAQGQRLKNRTTTYAREFAAQGLDWEDEFRQIAKEKALMDQLGLTPVDLQTADTGEEADE
jgi:lambda family phage portal protein